MVLALCCCCYVHTVVTSYQFCCFVCNETFFVYCAAFRLSDCAGGAAGCHGEPENHRGGAGSVGPPLPGEDPTDCKESCHSSLLPCHFMLRACSQPQPSVVSHHTFAVALSAHPPPLNSPSSLWSHASVQLTPACCNLSPLCLRFTGGESRR